MGRVGSAAIYGSGWESVSQLPDHPHVGSMRGPIAAFDCDRTRLQPRHGRRHSEPVSAARHRRPRSAEVTWPAAASNTRVPRGPAEGRADAAARIRIRLQCLVRGAVGCPPEEASGLAFSDERVRRLLREEGFSFQRPKHTMKGKRDETAYRKAQRRLKRLKKGRSIKLAVLS